MQQPVNSSLRLVMLSGDWIPLTLPEQIKQKFDKADIVSLGGATEASIWSIYYPIKAIKNNWKSIPYGIPMANQKLYVLNNEMELCPVGVQGELYIGGVGVAKGYLNDKEKTRNAFIYHPKLGYIYRTGDYGILHKEEYIEFLGRKDQQVKIKGYRIELGEIESQLIKHISVKNAVVIDRTDHNGKKYLCAYIVTDDNLTISEFRAFLEKEFPGYMVPARFVFMEQLPLTANGKVDRKKLPEPEMETGTIDNYRPPENETEETLVSLWQDILRIKLIGTKDNFFELGADSLNATRLVSLIKKEFNVEIPLNEIFRAGTINEIAKYISSSSKQGTGATVENMVLLKKGTTNHKNLFFIHAGSGEIEAYLEISNRLRDDFNYWAIRAEPLRAFGPQNLTIEELGSKYLQKIKQVQPCGPYYLSGWCAGGTVAFEIARQLEEESEKVEFLALINSLAPQRGLIEDEREFCIDTEIELIKKYIDINNVTRELHKNISSFKHLDQVWDMFIAYMEINNIQADTLRTAIPQELARLIPSVNQLGLRELVYYINVFRTSRNYRAFYTPSNSISAQVYFFEASSENITNKDRWNIFCDLPIKNHDIMGNHVSILRRPDVEQVARVYNKAFVDEVD